MHRWSVTLCVLTLVAADFHGCEATSAMQNADARQLDEKFVQLQSMQQIVDSFAGIKWSDDPAQRKANAKVLNTFLTTIENSMEKFLLREHDDDQKEWEDSKTRYYKCYSEHNKTIQSFRPTWESTTSDSSSNQPVLAEMKEKFRTCLASHYAWQQYFDASKTCELSDAKFGKKNEGHTTMCEWMECAEDAYLTYRQTKPTDDTKANCELEQERYETEFCAVHDGLQTSCNERTRCVKAEDFVTLKQKITNRTENRDALWKTMQILKCRVKVLLGGGEEDSEGYRTNGSWDQNTYASNFSKEAHAVCDSSGSIVKFRSDSVAGPTDCSQTQGNDECVLNLAAVEEPDYCIADDEKLCSCPVVLSKDGVEALPTEDNEEACEFFRNEHYASFTVAGNRAECKGMMQPSSCTKDKETSFACQTKPK